MLCAILSLTLLFCVVIISFILPFHASIFLIIIIAVAGWLIYKQKLIVLIGEECELWNVYSISEDKFNDET